MSKPIVFMLIGLQGSGKSTLAKELSATYNATILNADTIRDQNPDWDNEKVFKLLHSQMKELVSGGKNIVLDNTNTTIKMRATVFQNLKGIDCQIIAQVLATPYQSCVERLKKRNQLGGRQVPLEALRSYYEGYQIPFKEEGFDDIVIANFDKDYSSNKNFTISSKMIEFDQRNSHHKFDLNEHCWQIVKLYFDTNYNDFVMREAARFHDIGKVFTQTFKENDENAHYYNHHNVGAYYMLENYSAINDCGYPRENFILDVLFYINYHMLPFFWNTDKLKEKWYKIFGQDKFDNLLLFNKYDKIASGTDSEEE